MNIFILDTDPVACAQAHCDRHVVKMILEHTQMVCSVAHKVGVPAPYRVAHPNHPCTLWVAQSRANVIWLAQLTHCLNSEKQHRFGGDCHKSIGVMLNVLPALLAELPDVPMTPYAQAMPDDVRHADAVIAYRRYYVKHKQHLHRWTKRTPPDWITNGK